MRIAESDLAVSSRRLRLAEGEVTSLQTRLTAKEAALDEALSEIHRLSADHVDGGNLRKQQHIDKLNAEVTI